MATILEKPVNSDQETVFPRHIAPVIDAMDGTNPSIAVYCGFPGEMRFGAWTTTYITNTLNTRGWLKCDGSAVSRTTYADLFAAIGTAFGVGDGSTTFNLPTSTDRYPQGAGGNAIGASGVGTATHSHSHTHTSAAHTHAHAATHTHTGGTHTHGGTTSSDGAGDTGNPSTTTTFDEGAGASFTVASSTHHHSGPSHNHTYTTSSDGAVATTASAPGTSDSTTPGNTGSDNTSSSSIPPSFVGSWIIHI